MKNIFKLIGIIALVAVIGFTMAGCKNGTTSSNPDDPVLPPPPPGFSVSGKFNKSVSEEVKFKLTETTEALSVLKTRSARAVSTEKVISGVIDDGDFTIRLSGIYNSDTGSYTASASASIIRYTINGVIDESGDSIGSTATLLVKDGEIWKATTYVITESKAPVTIAGTPQIPLQAVFPPLPAAFGNTTPKMNLQPEIARSL